MSRGLTYWAKISSTVLLITVALFLWPFFCNITADGFNLLHDSDQSFGAALQNSILFAVLSSLIIMAISLLLAVQLSGITLSDKWGKLLSLLLFPSILGNVSTAFIWKLQLLNNAYFYQNSARNFLALLLMQGWQYGTLFCYLFWLQVKQIKKEHLLYCKVARLSYAETVKDVILPRLKNLAILLLMVQFLFSFYEDAKIQFIFKASRGTNSEMLTQWFQRNYQSGSLINTTYAFQQITLPSLVTIITIVGLLSIFSVLVNWLYIKYIKNRIVAIDIGTNSTVINKLWIILLCTLIFIPIVSNIVHYYHYSPHSFVSLITTLLYCLTAALLATSFAVGFGMLARLGWENSLNSFQIKAIPWIMGVFILGLIPPVALMASGYDWMSRTGYQSTLSLDMVWVLGQVLVSFPLLGSFIIFTHFQVKNEDILYLQVHRANFWEVSSTLFTGPFLGNYLLTFIISVALIWNESVLNSILSDQIPSFVSQMQMVITGRMVDYAVGMEYLFISIILALSAILIWTRLIKKEFAE